MCLRKEKEFVFENCQREPANRAGTKPPILHCSCCRSSLGSRIISVERFPLLSISVLISLNIHHQEYKLMLEENNENESLRLRIIQVNDVYALDNFPSLKTLIQEKRQGVDKLLVVLAGDFLGPSILSSLDKGRGMVDCMNHCGFTHVCFGNHETDVPAESIAQRILQSDFCWLNTNMRDLDRAIDIDTHAHDVVTVTGATSSNNKKKLSKKVGLLGLLTEDPSLYRPGSFGGARIDPLLETAKSYLKETALQKDVDLLIPLTHQRMPEDIKFANEFKGDVFPVIIGGHDHEPYDETHSSSRIIKAGYDAINAAIIDVKWEIGSDGGVADKPVISVEMVPTNTFAPNKELQTIVEAHEHIVKELDAAKVFCFKDWMEDGAVFSTENNRLGDSTGSTVLCTVLRMAMRATVGITNAGTIRGNTTYPAEQEWFTWGDLKSEMPFSNQLVAVKIPGRVLEATITESRNGIRCDPPRASGGYLHHCTAIKYSNETCKIESIGSEPFDPDKLYLTTLPGQFFDGLDNHEPLLEWAKTANLTIDEESGKAAKLAVIEMFSALMWLDMGSFADIDTSGDGVISREEVQKRAEEVFGDQIADLVV